MENQVTGKRTLDDDNDHVNRDSHGQKKFKSTHYNELLSFENIHNENENSNRWKLLPSVVYELLALFKKSEDQNQLNNYHNTKKELKILPNTNCQEKLIISVNKNKNQDIDKKSLIYDENLSYNTEHLKSLETNKSTVLKPIKPTVDNSTPSLDKQSLFTIKKENVEVKKKTVTTTTTTFDANIKKNDTQSLDKQVLFTIKKENVEVKKKTVTTTTTIPDANIKKNDVQKINKEEDKIDKKTNSSKRQHAPSVSNTSNPVKKISSIPTQTIKISEDHTKKYLKTETMFKLDKKEQLLSFLKTLYLNDISQPTKKPPLCNCQYCVYVDNLTIEQSLANKQFTYKNNFHYETQNLDCNMYSSNIIASDCSSCASRGIYTTNNCFCLKKSDIKFNSKNNMIETPKDIWVNNLISSMRENEKISNPIKTVMNKVYKAVDKIKLRLASCDACKKSKNDCKCNAQRVIKNIYNENLPIEKRPNISRSHRSRKYRRY